MRYATAAVAALFIAASVSAEIYKGIGPLDTLADVKARFPNASFETMKPAWAQEEDVMYRITGAGLSGTIVVKFYDLRPMWRREAEKEPDEAQRDFLLELANTADDSVSVEWVRWVPDEPIPVQRFISKYGAPEVRGFDDDDLQPFRAWETRGITAYLTDDEKHVIRVDYAFTTKERCQAYRAKYGKIPEYMKNDCLPKQSKPKPKK